MDKAKEKPICGLKFQIMRIGIPKEIKTEEYRVAITPSGVEELVKRGHTVYVQENAGIGSGINNFV